MIFLFDQGKSKIFGGGQVGVRFFGHFFFVLAVLRVVLSLSHYYWRVKTKNKSKFVFNFFVSQLRHQDYPGRFLGSS